MNKKHKNPYDYLNKYGTYKHRQEFIETEYINGVRDEKGNLVIRPMNDEEIAFLSQYYEETEHGGFRKNDEIEVARKKLKKLKKLHHRGYDVDSDEPEHPEVEKQKLVLEKLREGIDTLYTDEKTMQEVTKLDNDRRNDIFTIAKITGTLDNFDLDEYDKFTSDTSPEVEITYKDMFKRKKK